MDTANLQAMTMMAMQRASGVASARALQRCNQVLQPQGLCLATADMAFLQQARAEALGDAGLVEVGLGIAPDLAATFASSPYLHQDGLVPTLAALQEAFYELRRTAPDAYGDDELLAALRLAFDAQAAGSVEVLAGMSAKDLLAGLPRTADEVEADAGSLGLDSEGDLPLPWSEDRWVDSFLADGWDGERWAGSHGR